MNGNRFLFTNSIVFIGIVWVFGYAASGMIGKQTAYAACSRKIAGTVWKKYQKPILWMILGGILVLMFCSPR